MNRKDCHFISRQIWTGTFNAIKHCSVTDKRTEIWADISEVGNSFHYHIVYSLPKIFRFLNWEVKIKIIQLLKCCNWILLGTKSKVFLLNSGPLDVILNWLNKINQVYEWSHRLPTEFNLFSKDFHNLYTLLCKRLVFHILFIKTSSILREHGNPKSSAIDIDYLSGATQKNSKRY